MKCYPKEHNGKVVVIEESVRYQSRPYVTIPTKRMFRDWNNKVMEFITIDDAWQWCQARMSIFN